MDQARGQGSLGTKATCERGYTRRVGKVYEMMASTLLNSVFGTY
jgi:hypothetical protein